MQLLGGLVLVVGVFYLLGKLGEMSGLGKLLASVLTYLFIALLSG